MRQEQEKEAQEKIERGELPEDALHDLPLPSLPYVCYIRFYSLRGIETDWCGV